ncbi:serine/arginine repetitive matrix protein 1-like [Mercenaria mercenaria]|uniref:serine/arginine repetitive matrix protein 1-like n=1 Tax=Mercenaria mercenaria TaxID=6596 RepID=UPI00234F834F|nr:serine/arginine repetitive matrix protein 1-like [Mercenaria mercenaria]XP_045166187.2 serine/arginine repetitive matrix protein 1-like [Mercenaria mercenaria]
MRGKSRKVMEVYSVIVIFCMLLGKTVGITKKVYNMDSALDCGYIGSQTIESGQSVTVNAKETDTSSSSQLGCTINFLTADNDATIRVDFESFIINTCAVKLYLSGDGSGSMSSYSCGDNPSTYFSVGRTVTMTLHRASVSDNQYGFKLKVTAVRNDRYPLPSDSNPIAVGLVIGIVGSIFGVIFIASCVGICCFRKYRARRRPFIFEHKTRENFDETSNSVSVGYTNESMRGSPASKKKLLAPSDSSDEKGDTHKRNGYPGNGRSQNTGNIPAPPPAPRPDILMNTGNRNDFRSRNAEAMNEKPSESQQNNPMLSALHSNPKFRNSFKENERDANERAKRISSTSSFERFGQAPSPPSSQENVSRPSVEPVPLSRSPKRDKQKRAGIGRQPRTPSFSSDELGQIERGRMNDGNSTASSSEAPISKAEGEKKKADTTHSLRPDRKGPKGRKKQTQSVSSALDPEPKPSPRTGRDIVASTDLVMDVKPSPKTQRDRFLESNREPNDSFEKMGSGRYSKRSTGRKSPRPPGKNSGRGFSHRRARSTDQFDSRPTTPSMYGSLEDLDLPPLKRSTSKTSLYSSRSSLYDRRRRRKGSTCSYGESVASHVRDDMSVGRHSRGYDDEFYSDESDFDGYEKPLSRRDRDRMYRSENDLGRRVKEIATQTLRETATQTGAEDSVTFESKRLVKKKRRSKSVSSSATQTTKKKKKTKSTERLDEIGKEKGKTGTKRSKSVPDILHSEELEKPKIKPKPKPRKSASAETHLDEIVKSASKENLADPKNTYYPQSEGFVPQPYPPQPAYPMMVQPGYQGQPGMPVGYPYPMQGAPQGYPGYPARPQQPPPQQMVPPQPPRNQPAPRQPRKSNWEMLCEMTDGEYKKDDVTETGSVASSVFTNNPASMQGYGPSYHPPAYNTHQFYLPVQPGTNQVQAPPPQNRSVDSYENAIHGVPPQDYENANFVAKNIPGGRQDDAMSKQSSWSQLKEMTEPPKATTNVNSKNSRNESVV